LPHPGGFCGHHDRPVVRAHAIEISLYVCAARGTFLRRQIQDYTAATICVANGQEALDQHIPVVALTAHASIEDATRRLRANGALRKPVEIKTLLSTIARFCHG